MSRTASLLIGLLAVTYCQAADPEVLKPSAEWSGSSEHENLEKIAPHFLTTHEGFGILWKAWGIKGEAPNIDFTESVVVVSTTRGGRLQVSYSIDEKDDLAIKAIGTRDLRPGFRYHVAVLDRAGIVSVNGVPLPPLPRLGGPALPVAKPYLPDGELTGSLKLHASNTTSHLVELWAAGFQKFHPKLKVTIVPVGGEALDPEFHDGHAAVTFVSRPVGLDELGAWEKKIKHRMMSFPICEDDIAIIVHKENPIKQVTLAQLKIAFGESKERTWGALGLTAAMASKPIFVHGRDQNSGTRNHLRRVILGEGLDTVGKAHGSYTSLVAAVAADPNSIGYCRETFVREGVRAVPIVVGDRTQPYIARTCSLVVAMPHNQPIPPLIKEFLVYLYRADGQTQLFQDGFRPLNKHATTLQLERLGVDEIK